MFLIVFAALIAAGETAKLDRTYLPPISAATAGGGPGSLQLPFSRSNDGAPENQDIPTGGFVNNHQGVVVEAALAGTRASGPQSALGGPRISYGSSDSKVGDAAFRVTNNRFPQGPASGLGPNEEPDLSAFHRPPSFKPGNIQIIRDYVSNTVKYQNNVGLDKFNYAFETDNGIKMSENGVSRDGIQAQGGYSYTGDDGKVYSVVYTADKNGYRPTGNHLPTPPPIPAEILESLKHNARDEAAGLVDDGSYDAKKYNTEDNHAENETNDKYNDRQSNKFGDRPVFAGGFINQNQQAFVAPTFNGQFGVNDASKDTAFSKPDLSKFDSLVQRDNRFGSIREPSKDNANNLVSNKQTENQFTSISINANMETKPLSQQKLQVQKPFEKPSFNRPSSYDTSNLGLLSSSAGSSQPSSVSSFDQMNQGAANNFGNGNNRFSGQAFLYQPTQGSFNLNANQGLPIEQSTIHNKPFLVQNSLTTVTSSQPSTGYFTSQPTQQFPSSNIQSSQNGRFPGSQFSSSPISASSNSISENSNQPVFTTPLKPSFPTKQPLTTLTTPLESFDVTYEGGSFSQSDINKEEDLDNKKISTTSEEFTTSLSQSSQSTQNIQEDSSTRYIGTDKPSFISLDNRFSDTQTTQSADSTQFIQPQAPDRSYIYNRPNKPFNTPFIGTGSISSSSPNSQVTSLLPQSSFFTNVPQTSMSSMKNGALIGPQSANLSRATQAPLTFPSRVSGVSTQLNSKPSFNIPSSPTFPQIIPTALTTTAQVFSIPNSETISSQGIQEIQHQDGNTSSPSQQNTEVYQYPKPTAVLPSQAEKQNLQSGQENSASKDSSFLQLNVFGTRKPTTQSSFNLKPHSQFFQGAFNNNGPNIPLFPKFDQQNATQVNSDKTQNQATGFNSQPQFGQQNFPTLPKKPEQTFGSGSRPQPQEIGLFGDKGQLNLSSASQFGSNPFISASSFSQGTSSGLNTPSILSQTEQETSFKPSEESTTQNTQSVLNNKEITSSQQQESVQPSFSAINKPFEFYTQKPLSQFGQQLSFSSRHPATDLTSPVTSQFSSLTSKFGNKPISVGTFNTQNKLSDISGQSSFTSKKPFSQTSPINLQESTQFNQNTLSKEQTTTYEQAGDSLDDKHTTLFPSSTKFQTGSFDTQRPTTQFGQSSFSINSQKPSSQSQFGSQQGISSFGQGSFNDKESTPLQFDQSTQQFGTDLNNKLSSQIPSSSQVQYNDNNKETTNTQFSVPSSFDQFPSTNQPSQLSTLLAGPLGQDNESKTTTSIQFDNKQQTMTSNEPSNLVSSTFEIQVPTQSSEFSPIYNYRKPVQGLLTPSQKQDLPQFQANIQFGQQGLLNIQKGKPAQFTQPLFNSPSSQFSIANEDKVESVTQQNSLGTFPSTQDEAFSTSQNSDQSSGEIYEYNKPSIQFGQQAIFNVQKEKPAQFTKPLFNSQFTTNEDKTETATQENILTGFPSTPEVLSSTLQNAAQNNGLIYDYNKPNKQFGQQLAISTQKEKPTQFSFNFASTQFSTIDDKSESGTQENILTGLPSSQPFSSTSDNSDQSTGEIYEYNKPEQSLSTSSENDGTTQFGQKIQSTPNANREDFFTNQQTDNIQNKNTDEQTSTTSGEINEQPRPQLAFHSACCGGLFKRPLGSNNLNPSFNILNQNKDSVSNQKPSQVDQSIDEQNMEPQKASSFTGVGEKFPSSREPPSFDVNGYYY